MWNQWLFCLELRIDKARVFLVLFSLEGTSNFCCRTGLEKAGRSKSSLRPTGAHWRSPEGDRTGLRIAPLAVFRIFFEEKYEFLRNTENSCQGGSIFWGKVENCELKFFFVELWVVFRVQTPKTGLNESRKDLIKWWGPGGPIFRPDLGDGPVQIGFKTWPKLSSAAARK